MLYCSPKHVPAKIIKTPEIPRTKSGKIVELAVKKIINGEKINNIEAIANPGKLFRFFQKFKFHILKIKLDQHNFYVIKNVVQYTGFSMNKDRIYQNFYYNPKFLL